VAKNDQVFKDLIFILTIHLEMARFFSRSVIAVLSFDFPPTLCCPKIISFSVAQALTMYIAHFPGY
jgi:hypothetical protein